MRPDAMIDEIRAIRHQISEQFNHDPKRLIDHYIQMQERYQDRLQKKDDRTDSVEKVRQTYPNAYAKWGTEDDLLLKEKYAAGYTVRELSELLGRQEGGIKARLKKLHLLS